ncbi:uncharacterized protein EI90DRAFT_3123727 [Cantharellus anzutake]|uniref:uncharacterized protein n=1 Tax=Cantharellus anzutake TaxID=1750568 RepID=UPI001904396E|nr:uncharacterized protein EI90DRAFT_3123727 [Cantharellus anzutake]KAF8331036.1 hypothetical protein EI90DRAFT_3123727 [Cantharellus anzutake]
MPGNIISDLLGYGDVALQHGAIDYLYSQRKYIVVGDFVGVNDTVLFGTMDQKLEGVEFEDHTALNLSVRCGIIPHTSGDSFDFSYSLGPTDDYPGGGTELSFHVYLKFTPIPGVQLLYMSNYGDFVGLINQGSGNFALGDEKPTSSTPPQFCFNDTLLNLYPQVDEDPGTFATALVTTKDYTLGGGRQGSPVQLTKEIQVYTSVATTNLSKSNITLESINITVNIWPIGCAIYTQNLTTRVSGSNHKLLDILGKHEYNSQPKFINMPFERKSNPANQLEKQFSDMVYWIYKMKQDFVGSSLPAENGFKSVQRVQPLPQAALSDLTSTSLSPQNQSLSLSGFEYQLSLYSAFIYGFTLMNLRRALLHDPNILHGIWSPIYFNTSGTHQSDQAIAQVAYFPLIIVTALSGCIMFISFFIIWDAFIVMEAVVEDTQQQVIHDGSLLNMISLLAASQSSASAVSHCCSQHKGLLDYDCINNAIVEWVFKFHLHISSLTSLQVFRRGSHPPISIHPLLQSKATYKPFDQVWTQPNSSKSGVPSGAEHLRPTSARSLWILGIGGILALIAFHGCLVVLSEAHVLDHLYFNIRHLGLMNQILSTHEEGFVVMMSALAILSVSSLACDVSLRERALHFTLGAWRQGPYSLVLAPTSVLKRLNIMCVFGFFLGIMVTHAATPTVVTTEAFNASIPTHFMADRIPGFWGNLSFSLQLINDIAEFLGAAPYLLGDTAFGANDILGWNQTTLNAPEYEGGTFYDPFATKYNVSCNVIPQSKENPYTGNIHMDDNPQRYLLSMNLTTDVNPYPGLSIMYWQLSGLNVGPEQQYASPKENESSTLVFPVPNRFALLQSQFSHAGVLPMVHISGTPHVVEGGAPLWGSYSLTIQTQMWTYVQNNSISSDKLDSYIQETRKLELVNVTMYLWLIMCTLHILNGGAVVTSNKLESFIPMVAEIFEPPQGYVRSEKPTHIIEINWDSLIYLLYDQGQGLWLEGPYNGTFSTQGGTSRLSEQLSLFTATYVALLDRSWRTKYESHAPIVGLSWKPLQAIVYGSKQVLSARFTIHIVPLYFGCLSALLIGVSSAVMLWNTFNRKDVVVKEAGIFHSIQMLQWSSLTHLFSKHQSLSVDGCRVSRDILSLDVQCNGLTLDIVHEGNDAMLDPLNTVDSTEGTRSSPPNVPPNPGATPGPQEGLDTPGPDQPSTSNVLGIEAPSLPEKDPPDVPLEPNRPPNAQIPNPVPDPTRSGKEMPVMEMGISHFRLLWVLYHMICIVIEFNQSTITKKPAVLTSVKPHVTTTVKPPVKPNEPPHLHFPLSCAKNGRKWAPPAPFL